jgi:hypothetical protein
MSDKIPQMNVHQPTVDLILCAYPEGIPNAHYLTLLSILAKDMSIRVLAAVIAHIRGGHYAVYMTDVVEAKRYTPAPGVAVTVKNKLLECGYEDWLVEADSPI